MSAAQDKHVSPSVIEFELARLRKENALLRGALQEIVDIEEGPGETDRPQMIRARNALKVLPDALAQVPK